MASNNTKSEHLLKDDDDEAEASPSSPPIATGVEEQGAMQTIAGVMGNVLEWYDFALFGFFSDIIATVFFAPSDEDDNANENGNGNGNNGNGNDDFVDMGGEIDTSNLVRSFAVYGGAFLMRPVGGLVIGYIGDKYGRKQALVLSLFLMAIPTFLM
mmetsp:Transcript_27634/g.50313  ORF Transcript_27634/g.50313 Transcript_27634/m.50313 type:complete len:156 (+) Transcript_27634:229-696(+)